MKGKKAQRKETNYKKCEHQLDYENNQERWTLFYGQQIVSGVKSRKVEEKQVRSTKSLNIVHQNIRSLWGKCEELEIVLATELNSVELLCFTEHWLNCNKIHAVNINNFMLANARIESNQIG